MIGETDFTSGPSTLHEKAIYIVEGQLYQVERFDFEGRKAYVRAVDCDYYTDAITYTKVTILDTFGRRPGTGGRRPETRTRPAGSRRAERPQPGPVSLRRTAKSTSSRASSDSRRSSSIRTRTSGRASWTCPSSRCTRRPTG